MNPEIQVYFFFHRVAPGNSQSARRENVAAAKYRLQVFLKYHLWLISQDLLRVSSFLIGCIL